MEDFDSKDKELILNMGQEDTEEIWNRFDLSNIFVPKC